MPAGDAPAERTALADEVLLADELVEVARAHPGGERLALGRWLEQGLGSGAGRSTGGWHDRMVARPARRPAPDAARSDRARSPVTLRRRPTGRSGSAISEPPTSAIRRTSRAT